MTTRPRILVAIDLTTRPDAICAASAELAVRLNAAVTLLSVVVMPAGVPAEARLSYGEGGQPATASDVLHHDARIHLLGLQACFTDRGVPVDVTSAAGDVVETILGQAEALDALYIVVGADVPEGFRRVLSPGFTASLIRASTRPVLVVPHSAGEPIRGRSVAQASVAAEADG